MRFKPEREFSGKILVVKYSALGDVVLASGAVRKIRETFPQSRITWLVTKPLAEMLEGQSYCDDLLVWDRSQDPGAFWKLVREIRKKRYDLLVDLQCVDRSALLSLLSGAKVRIGFHKWLKFCYSWTPGSDWRHEDPFLERQGRILEGIGIENGYKAYPFLDVGNHKLDRAREHLGDISGRRLFAVLGASTPVKAWPLQNWVGLMEKLLPLGWSFVAVGNSPDEVRAAEVLDLHAPAGRFKNLVGQLRLSELAAVAKQCDAALGGDTGPLHIAGATGIPVVGLFGPSNPRWAFPGREGTIALECDCPQRGCLNWNCPRLDCLADISPERVANALERLITAGGGGLDH